MTSKRVLITGASGFTGKYLVATLASRGLTTMALQRGSGDIDAKQLTCDLCQPDSIAQALTELEVDYVIHLAAISFVGHDSVDAFYQVNLMGTANLLEALASMAKKPRKVILASSANVYGNPHCDPISEACCPAPINHYAISKLAMEHLAMTWFDRLPIIITRPFNYTGVGQNECFLIPKIINHYKRRASFIELGNTHVSRDFMDVIDVARIYADLLETDTHSEIVNICSGVSVSLQEIIDMMNDIAGYTIEVRVNPAYVRTHEIQYLRGDPAKLHRLLGVRQLQAMQDILHRMFVSEE